MLTTALHLVLADHSLDIQDAVVWSPDTSLRIEVLSQPMGVLVANSIQLNLSLRIIFD